MNLHWIAGKSLILMLACSAAVRGAAPGGAAATRPAPAPERVPVIYSTDLFHPHDDPDDHFDLATLFAIERFDIRAVILDLGDRQANKPGRIPLEQMLAISGRRVPWATGLSARLRSPADTASSQPPADQGGVNLLLSALRESPRPVRIITAGSLRDVCAAFNREPGLFRRQVERLYINVGHADGGDEWNVGLDPHAYVGIMRSGLPVYWCPCLPMKDARSAHWEFGHAAVLETAPPVLQNFFIYALQVVPPDLIAPEAALGMDLRAWRHLVWQMRRQMWCTASFLDAAGLEAGRTAGGYGPVAAGTGPGVFTFVSRRVEIDDQGHTRLAGSAEANMRVLQITDPGQYGPAMTDCLRRLLAGFPLAGRYRG